MIRSFIAIPIIGEAARQLRGRQSPIPGARMVSEEDLHLTLAFLGDQPEPVLRDLANELDALTLTRFEITLDGAVVLGSDRPRGIALNASSPRVGGEDRLGRLQETVVRAVRGAGLDLQRRKFRPHVTLYRLPRSQVGDSHSKIQSWVLQQTGAASIAFTATAIELIESRLTPEGPVYTSLADFPFAGHFADPSWQS